MEGAGRPVTGPVASVIRLVRDAPSAAGAYRQSAAGKLAS